MSVLHWLDKQSRRSSILGVIYIHHATKHADYAYNHVYDHCRERGINFRIGRLDSTIPKGESKENWWRQERYKFFKSLSGGKPVILGHHFDDCLEELIMASFVRGFAGTIPYAHANCVRPFRLWKRKSILEYAIKNNVQWIEDPSNVDVSYKRNYIRKEIVPRILTINPGVYNIVEKLIKSERYS